MVFYMMFDFIRNNCFTIVNIVFWHTFAICSIKLLTYLLTYKMHKPSKVCLMAIHCNSPVDGSLVEMLLRRGKTTAKLCRKLRGKHHKLQLDQKRSPGLPDSDPRPPGRPPSGIRVNECGIEAVQVVGDILLLCCHPRVRVQCCCCPYV